SLRHCRRRARGSRPSRRRSISGSRRSARSTRPCGEARCRRVGWAGGSGFSGKSSTARSAGSVSPPCPRIPGSPSWEAERRPSAHGKEECMGVEKYTVGGRSFWKVDEWLTLDDQRTVRFRQRKIPTKELALAIVAKKRAEAFEGRFFDRKREP